MKRLLAAAAMLLLSGTASMAQSSVGEINTNWRLLGPDDKIVIERYDDPLVANVSCYMSRAQTGGVVGWVGLATDPSKFSIACRAVGPVSIPAGIPRNEVVGFASASPFFKSFKIFRIVDKEKGVLTYTVVSTSLINGSPFTPISAVATLVP